MEFYQELKRKSRVKCKQLTIREEKKVSQISSIPKFRSMESLHGPTGKENSQSVQLKVQKDGTNDSIDELRKATFFSQFDVTLEEPSLLQCHEVKHVKSEPVDSMHKFANKMGSLESECTLEDQNNS